jgi:flagellar biosynthetic protein FliR
MVPTLGASTLLAFLLATVRAGAWLVVAPPFNGRSVPGPVKALLAVALALPVTSTLSAHVPSTDMPSILGAVVMQVAVGMGLGFVVYLLMSAIAAAGSFIDLFGGFTLASAFDPLSLSQNAVFGRLHQFLMVLLLLVSDAHLIVLQGFFRSYQAIPLDGSFPLSSLSSALVVGMGGFFLAALQIAAPLICVMFLADVGLGLLTKIAPALNAFQLGFPMKMLLTLLLAGLTFPLLPGAVEELARRATPILSSLGG